MEFQMHWAGPAFQPGEREGSTTPKLVTVQNPRLITCIFWEELPSNWIHTQLPVTD